MEAGHMMSLLAWHALSVCGICACIDENI